MICEQINKCDFISCVRKVIPVTAKMIKAKYCNNVGYGCAKYQEHEIIALDKERRKICPGIVMGKLEIFEKNYSESYQKLCVRRHRVTTGNQQVINLN